MTDGGQKCPPKILCKLPIDKLQKMWYNWRPALCRAGRNFHYTTAPTKNQLTNWLKREIEKIPNLCNITTCKIGLYVVYYHCSQEREPTEGCFRVIGAFGGSSYTAKVRSPRAKQK